MLVGGVGSQTVLPGTEVTARFGADGSLSGSGGCNNYNGGFMAFDQTLRISNLTSSKALCAEPEGIMEQENALMSLLTQAAKMKISAGQLEVFDRNDNRILVFINGSLIPFLAKEVMTDNCHYLFYIYL